MEKKFEHSTFSSRLSSMLKVDLRRMFTMPLIYIFLGCCLAMPVLILVMTTMMDGSVTIDPQTGAETVINGFDNVWQIIGSVSGAGSAVGMDITGMCNINLLYFFAAALVCIFVAEDYRSGYAKNLFTVRAKKEDYVISKTLVCSISGALMLLAFFLGSILGGAIAGLPFEMAGFNAANLVLCLVSKLLLMAVFVPIYLCMAVIGRQRLWLSLILSMMVSMLLFMMIPMLTPLDAGMMNIMLCLSGAVVFCIALGTVSRLILDKKDLI